MDGNNNLAGFGGRFRPTESLWSIGSKVCWANSMSGPRLRELMRDGSGRKGRSKTLITGRNLEFGSLYTMTGIPVQTAKDGTGLFFGTSESVLIHMAYPNLRYCPKCLFEDGFHSILFQLPLTTHCLIHTDTVLREACPHCAGPIAYRWPSTKDDAFRCPNCKFLLH
jgi:hypothetical protein